MTAPLLRVISSLTASCSLKFQLASKYKPAECFNEMKNLILLKSTFLATALCLLLFSFPSTAQTKKVAPKTKPAPAAAKDNAGKITQLLGKSVEQYRKITENIWTVAYQGESIGKFDLIVATVPDTELFFMSVPLAKKKDLRINEDLLYKLLRYNNSADYVKVGFDDDGDLFLRAEVNARLIDLKEFKIIIEQVAAASNQLHEQIKDSITTKTNP